MPVKSLDALCRKACIKNIHALLDVGDLQYHQISDILSCIKSAEQLHFIEETSPQIKGEDAELWQKFIAREIPNWATKNYAPANPLEWYEIYKRYKREQAAEIKRDEEVLRRSMMGLQKVRDSHVSKFVELRSLPKLPRDPRMVANNGGVRIGKNGFKKETPSSLNWTGGSKTKITDGRSVLTKARREAKEISQMSKLSRPTHELSIGRVEKAPAAMVKEHRNATQPALKILSRRPAAAKVAGISDSVLERHEKRLLAFTKNENLKPNFVDSDEEEEEDEEGEEERSDLFDEITSSLPNSKMFSQKPRIVLPLKNSVGSVSSSNSKPSAVISAAISKPRSSIPRSSNIFSAIRKPTTSTTRYITQKVPISSTTTSCSPDLIPPPAVQRPISSLNHSSSSPSGFASTAPRPLIRRRKEVDCFNRAASKRPKLS